MVGYERTYRTGRSIASILEIVGWLIVAIGTLSALGGLITGGFLGIASREIGNGNTPLMLRIVAMVPGILLAAVGLFFIMLCQQTKATLDNAEMTRDMLGLAKAGSSNMSNRSASNTVAKSDRPAHSLKEKNRSVSFDEDGSGEYRGKTIRRDGTKFRVNQATFDSVDDAKNYIDMRS